MKPFQCQAKEPQTPITNGAVSFAWIKEMGRIEFPFVQDHSNKSGTCIQAMNRSNLFE
jgi:hypothetical protein